MSRPNLSTSIHRKPPGLFLPLGKRALVLLIVTAAVLIGVPRQLSIRELQRSLAIAQSQASRAEEAVGIAESALDRARQKLRRQTAERQRAQVEVARVEQQLATAEPESQWVRPPDLWPEWNPRSPYVWLSKEALPMFPVPAFEKDGTLNSEVAAILTLDRDAQNALNKRLSGFVNQYHALETAHAEVIDDPLPGLGGDGPTITLRVRPFPEDGVRLRQAFEGELHVSLGDQRADLLIQTARYWLNSEFGSADPEGMVISGRRGHDNTYNISIRSRHGSMAVGGVRELDQYVPPHLLSFFSDLHASPQQ